MTNIQIRPKNLNFKLFYFSEDLKKQLMDAIDGLCHKIEEQLKFTLTSIEPDVLRLLDDKYKTYFLQKVNSRYCVFQKLFSAVVNDSLAKRCFIFNRYPISTCISQFVRQYAFSILVKGAGMHS